MINRDDRCKACGGLSLTLRMRDCGAGGVQYRFQCDGCGRTASNAIKHDAALKIDPNPQPWRH